MPTVSLISLVEALEAMRRVIHLSRKEPFRNWTSVPPPRACRTSCLSLPATACRRFGHLQHPSPSTTCCLVITCLFPPRAHISCFLSTFPLNLFSISIDTTRI
ncbi:hypothetical protein VFPPC_18753 [Pochonia chlamydosporia 170]|uniref:Uncharacterized protein n=1 Tax=Pochonia chlamydosporia 170 TaxID=1380566 RepID=A0A219ARX6_METCM|nr:hypothetical protein VFPPC_18753 [Pochonia chlamydosporia 170]OWT43520.1 hypothetical protein VFPPC_18753 [Pochonia chlamydosporia 170]